MTHDRFSRAPDEVTPPVPSPHALKEAMRLRVMRACWSPLLDEPARTTPRRTLGDLLAAGPAELAAAMRGGTHMTLLVARIQPSFHAHAELGLARLDHGEGRRTWRLGMVVGGCAEATACVDLDVLEEPTLLAPQPWPPPPGPGGATLDGCAYQVHVSSDGLDVTYRFRPRGEPWTTWVREVRRLAQKLVDASGNADLGAYVETWGAYARPAG